MHVWFGTVIRAAPVQRGGSLVKLDWDSKQVVREVPIVPSDPALDHDPNERGNVRGCRGIQVVGDEVVAADYHTLQIFDHDLNPVRRLSHGQMVGLHEIQAVDGSMWVTATTLDAALKFDMASGALEAEFWPREMPAFQQALDVEPLPVDKTSGDQLVGGSINQQGLLTFEATRVGAETALAHIIRLVREAQGSRAPIQAVADRLRAGLRETDSIARYGGEEFSVIFPRTPVEEALPHLEMIRGGIAGARFIPRGKDRPKKKPMEKTLRKRRRLHRPGSPAAGCGFSWSFCCWWS